MRRMFLLVVLQLSIGHAAFSQTENLRQLYFSASDNKGKEVFFQTTRGVNESDAAQLAYKGVASAMYAEVTSKVKEKFEWFNLGKEQLEKAVSMNPSNPEIIFLRFSIQSEVPGFLGYHDNIAEDANFIIGSLRAKKIDPNADFWKKAIRFMQKSGELNKLQEAELSKYGPVVN